MARKPRILAFSGSTRGASYNQKLVHLAAEAARQAEAEVTEIALRDYPLPLFDEDIEKGEGLPGNARKLKDIFLDHQGLLLACPEYNSSITAVLKNTIDWVSRPEVGQPPLNCFAGKTALLLSASPGALGGLRGLVHVRAILGNIQVMVLPEQLAISKAHEAFDSVGKLKEPGQQKVLESITNRLVMVLGKLHG